jgi:hypothetical protein
VSTLYKVSVPKRNRFGIVNCVVIAGQLRIGPFYHFTKDGAKRRAEKFIAKAQW